MTIALILGLVLVAVPLYLWRRPRTESDQVARAPFASSASLPEADASVVQPVAIAGDGGLPRSAAIPSDVRLLSCHDPGPKKTPVDRCDRLPTVESAFAKAVADAATCSSANPGMIVYVLDVSFTRKAKPILLTAPKEGRTVQNARAVTACTQTVRKNLSGFSLAGVEHKHAQYRMALTATYGAGGTP